MFCDEYLKIYYKNGLINVNIAYELFWLSYPFESILYN